MDVRPGSPGRYSAQIKVTKSNWTDISHWLGSAWAQMGTLTTGTLYFKGDAGNASSCIYTNTDDNSKRWAFTGRPDSIVFWAKWAQAGRPADMTLYLHGNSKFEDRNPNGTASGTVIGSAHRKITRGDGNWIRYSVPVSYQTQENPAYMLLSFTAGNNFREVVEGDELLVDDVLLVYDPVLTIDTLTPLTVAYHGNESIEFELPYTFFSGTAAPLDAAAQNKLSLYISDADGSFDHARLLAALEVPGGDNIRHEGRIKVSLPASTTDSDKYRIKLVASNYALESNIIDLDIYKQWYLTILPASGFGQTNAVDKKACRDASRQTALAAANPDCVFLRWEENGHVVEGAEAEYVFNITGDRTLRAVFDTTFTLRFAPATGARGYFANGEIRPQEITLVHGETAKMRADLEIGYCFQGFELDGIAWHGEKPEHDYVAVRGGTVHVLTDSIAYDFAFSVYPDAKLGTITESGDGTYKHFSTVSAQAAAANEYSRFSHWEDTDGNVAGTESLLRLHDISKGGSYRAVFDETFHRVRLSVSNPLDGYALQCAQRKADSSYSAFDLTHVYLRAVPERGIGFRRWEVKRNGIGQADITENPYDLTNNTHLDADYEFHAVFDTLMYHLSLSARNGAAEGEGTYVYGRTVLLRCTPEAGFHFSRWESASGVLGFEDTLRVRIFGDTAITAVCEPDEYLVEIRSNDAVLGRVDKSSGMYAHFTELDLHAMAASGAELRYWVIDGDTLGTETAYTLKVKGPSVVLAVFSHVRSNVSLHVENGTSGTVHGAGIYEWHSPVEIRAEAFSGYRFDGWRTPQGDTIRRKVIRIGAIEGDTSLQALFSPLVFDLRLQAEGAGRVFVGTPADGQDHAQVGYMEYVEINAVPQAGHEFEGWYDKDGKLLGTYAQDGLAVRGDTVIRGRFVPVRHSLDLFVSPLGSGVLRGAGRYAEDTEVAVQVDPSGGYDFLGWYEADTLYSADLSFSLRLFADRYFTAKFKERRFPVSVKAEPASMAVSCSGSGDYLYAYNAKLQVEPVRGYEVSAWLDGKGDTVGRGNPCLYDVFGAGQLTAHMRPAPMDARFGIEPEAAGRVRCGEVLYGQRAAATAVPSYGHAFSCWKNAAGEILSRQPVLEFVPVTDTSFTAVFEPLKYKVEGRPRHADRGRVKGSGSYAYGSTCTLEVEHDEHYYFGGWFDKDGIMLSRQHGWTFEVTGPVDVTARFEPLPVFTYLTVEPENSGAIRYAGGQMQGVVKVLYGQNISLDVEPAEGMAFKLWRRQDTAGLHEEWQDEAHTFIPQGGRHVTLVMDTLTYGLDLQVEPPGTGQVRGGGTYKHAARAVLEAEPAAHYRFHAYMAGDQVLSYDSAYSIKMDSSMSVRALFRPADHMVRVFSSDPDRGQVSGTGRYGHGSLAMLEAFAWRDSLAFSHWSRSADGSDVFSSDASLEYRVSGDDTLYAFFAPAMRGLTLEAEGRGSVQGAGRYRNGSHVKLNASAEPGYHFSAWKEYGIEKSRDPEWSVVMESDRTLQAVFEPDTFRLRLHVPPQSGLSVFGAGEYACGSRVNVWTGDVPAPCRFLAWKDDSGEVISQAPGFVLTLDRNVELHVVLDTIRHTIGLRAEGEGEVSGAGEYVHGSRVSLSAVPAKGYRFEAWYGNGKVFCESACLDFVIPGDLDLLAVFEKDVVPVHPVPNMEKGGEIIVSADSDTASSVTLSARASESYHFVYWTSGDSIVGSQENIEVARSEASRMVAHFSPDTYHLRLFSSTPEGLSELTGSGSFHGGDEARLKAVPRKGHVFEGWFEAGSETPLATDAEHVLTVTRDMRIEARTREISTK